jgi:hypothetical protein
MRKRVFAPVTVSNEPLQERLGKVALGRGWPDRTIRTLHAEALVSLPRRPAQMLDVSPAPPASQTERT